MNKVVVGVFSIAAIFALGQALECYKCGIGFPDLCVTTVITCSHGEQCFSGAGKVAQVMDIKMKGCLKTDECDQESNVELSPNKTIYTINKTCCAMDLCNPAPSFPRLAPVTLSLATLASTLVAPAFL